MATNPPKVEESAPAINVSAAVKAATLVKETVQALTAQRASLIEERGVLETRNAELWDMPLSGEQAQAFVLSSVDMLADEYPKRIDWNRLLVAFSKPAGTRQPRTGRAPGTRSSHGGPLSLADVHQVGWTLRVSGSSAAEGLRGLLNKTELGLLGKGDSESIERALCYFFRDQIKALISGRFDRRYFEHGTDKGPTLEDRRTEIQANSERMEAIGEELIAVEAQLAELVPMAR